MVVFAKLDGQYLLRSAEELPQGALVGVHRRDGRIIPVYVGALLYAGVCDRLYMFTEAPANVRPPRKLPKARRTAAPPVSADTLGAELQALVRVPRRIGRAAASNSTPGAADANPTTH